MSNTIAALVREPGGTPSARAPAFWRLNAAMGWAVVLLLEVLWAWLGNRWASPAPVVVLAVTLVAAAVHLIVMPPWRYRIHRWEISGDAVFVRSGWWTQEYRVAPISRIQTIDSRRGFLHRLMGLTSVTVTTASAAGPLTIHALDDAVAREVIVRLTEATEQSAGDAT